MTIDLVAQGPVYRGHKLARIVEEYVTGDLRGKRHKDGSRLYHRPTSTKAWARLDVRVIGNPWGLSVSELPRYYIPASVPSGYARQAQLEASLGSGFRSYDSQAAR